MEFEIQSAELLRLAHELQLAEDKARAAKSDVADLKSAMGAELTSLESIKRLHGDFRVIDPSTGEALVVRATHNREYTWDVKGLLKVVEEDNLTPYVNPQIKYKVNTRALKEFLRGIDIDPDEFCDAKLKGNPFITVLPPASADELESFWDEQEK
jgi:hypothetical protein